MKRIAPLLRALPLLLVPVAASCAGYTAAEQEILGVYAAVPRWRGYIEVTRRNTNYFDDGVYHEDGYDDNSARATFILEQSPDAPHAWHSQETRVTGTYETQSRSSNPHDRTESSDRASYSGSAIPNDISLDIGKPGEQKTLHWVVTNEGKLVKSYVVYHEVAYSNRPGYVNSTSQQNKDYWPHTVVSTPLTGLVKRAGILTRTAEVVYQSPPGERNKRTGLIRTKIVLVPDDADLELIVDIESYATWLPKGALSGNGRGSELTAFATLRPKAGKAVTARPKKFHFMLRDTSKEPGVCMNWPRLAADSAGTPKEDPEFDLRFDPAGGKLTNANGQELDVDQIEETADHTFRAHATIQAFDFGGYGDLLVSAEFDDGGIVYGQLKGKGDTLIPLPKRRPGSVIADVYREKWKCDDADQLDNDPEPKGDGNSGDGFSTYEEYRGFICNGRHLRTRPGTKDLFVVNKLGDVAIEGIARFELATGLEVHEETLPAELTEDRVANPNRSAKSPRTSQELQHGLLVDLRTEKDGVSEAEIGEGVWRPKNVKRVAISASLVDGAASDAGADELAGTVAHELSHGCGVRHHGDNDKRWVVFQLRRTGPREADLIVLECGAYLNPTTGSFEIKTDANGAAHGSQVRLLNEDGEEFLPNDLVYTTHNEMFVYLGVFHGEHSGNTGCFMRYNVAHWYKPEASPRDRVYFPDKHPVQTTLCEGSASDGNWKKRFGDAARGDCKHRFAVRDDAPEMKEK